MIISYNIHTEANTVMRIKNEAQNNRVLMHQDECLLDNFELLFSEYI